MATIRFDDAVPALLAVLEAKLSPAMLNGMVVTRDGSGRVGAVLQSVIAAETLDEISGECLLALQGYARGSDVLRDRSSFGADAVLAAAEACSEFDHSGYTYRFLDRRIVGQDWLLKPAPAASDVPRVVFASLKGGVGRSTALSVVASHLSRLGKRVLALDLDLEAPGIGTMLLEERAVPKYGSLDYLVENGISGISDDFVIDVVGSSFLGQVGARVSVMPAIGTATMRNPSNALAKLSRAYLEDVREGEPVSFASQVSELVGMFAQSGEYDIILVDSRAGLHESAAASLLALGGEILLFGVDQPQTFLGYNLLLAHLATLPVDDQDDWRERLTFVNARASESAELRMYSTQRFEALSGIIYPATSQEAAGESLTASDFEVEWDDSLVESEEVTESDSIRIINILDDRRYVNFDPLQQRDLLTDAVYRATFEQLIIWIESIFPEDDLPLSGPGRG